MSIAGDIDTLTPMSARGDIDILLIDVEANRGRRSHPAMSISVKSDFSRYYRAHMEREIGGNIVHVNPRSSSFIVMSHPAYMVRVRDDFTSTILFFLRRVSGDPSVDSGGTLEPGNVKSSVDVPVFASPR